MSDKLQPPSGEFWDAICDSGSPCATCGFCGRLNFDYNGEFMEEGELEKYQQGQKEHPEKYHGQDGCISYGWFNDLCFVHGCPCNQARKYEDFIWRNRWAIASYLKSRSGAQLQEAQRDAEHIDAIPQK